MNVTFNEAGIPDLLKQHPRWLLWTVDGSGKKAPRRSDRPARNCDGANPANWTSFPTAVAATATHSGYGLGFALGSVQDGPTFSGIDLDKCRNPETGHLEPWALRVIRLLNSYTEISPSGTGVKIFVQGTLPEGAKQGKVYKIELYDRRRYFTVTGTHLDGTPTSVEPRDTELRDVHRKLWSADLVDVLKVFGLHISDTPDWVNIHCPWEANHTPPTQVRDSGLKRDNDGKIVGFNCFHAGCADKTLGDVLKLFGRHDGHSEFVTGQSGQILKNEPENIRRALAKLGYDLTYDRFSERVYVTVNGQTAILTEALYDRAWFAISETFHFLPPAELFYKVVQDEARAKSFHAVWDYLAGVRWDGVKRLDKWLTTYGKADDTPYVNAVGALTLMAAVRRVRQPGCLFQEMLVLESPQGTLKSGALATLCPRDEWFSDDFSLGLDSQEVIEHTGGKWIIEAAELKGIRHSEVERLKNFISRSTDGPVRRAWGRIAEERPRQFIFIGTTNSGTYLRDSTGNRRYWPVRVGTFDIVNLRRDRDQLWAEAVVREAAPGETIRLRQDLWAEAAREQEQRRQDDGWEEPLLNAIGDSEVVPARVIWEVLGVFGASASNNTHAARVSEIMERNGYVRPKGGVHRVDGKPQRCWIKSTSPLFGEADSVADALKRPTFVPKVNEG